MGRGAKDGGTGASGVASGPGVGADGVAGVSDTGDTATDRAGSDPAADRAGAGTGGHGAGTGGHGAGTGGRGPSTTGGVVAKRRMNAVITIAIVAACVAALALQRLSASSTEAAVAVVTDGDGTVYELPLSQDAELTITTGLGTNVVVVQDGEVFVREADCPNQDCVEMGPISSSGQQIICLPHELVIEISDGTDSESDVESDVISS